MELACYGEDLQGKHHLNTNTVEAQIVEQMTRAI
jgi:hypothetical protein